MSVCTFFGHHDCPTEVKPKLREVLIDLIENHSVDVFTLATKELMIGWYAPFCGNWHRNTITSITP